MYSVNFYGVLCLKSAHVLNLSHLPIGFISVRSFSPKSEFWANKQCYCPCEGCAQRLKEGLLLLSYLLSAWISALFVGTCLQYSHSWLSISMRFTPATELVILVSLKLHHSCTPTGEVLGPVENVWSNSELQWMHSVPQWRKSLQLCIDNLFLNKLHWLGWLICTTFKCQ